MQMSELSQQGETIYHTRILPNLPVENLKGKIIAIDVESGEYFIEQTVLKAIMLGRQRYPQQQFYCKRIGYPAVYSYHSHRPVKLKDKWRMITGTINDKLEPLRDDIFIESQTGWIALRTILDTGFNGEFCLPRQYAQEAQLEYLGEVKAELADGDWIIEEVYLGTILVNNQPHLVEMTLTDSATAVLGMAMLLEQEAIFNLHTMTIRVSWKHSSGHSWGVAVIKMCTPILSKDEEGYQTVWPTDLRYQFLCLWVNWNSQIG